MSETTTLDGPRVEPLSGGPARQLVVLLHGLGADGNDLIELAPYLGQSLPDAAFVSPHAPFACDMAPMGRQWFSLQSVEPEKLLEGAEAAAPILERFLRAELEHHGLGAGQLALVGFSQGGMMALHVGLRWAEPVAAICGFSTALIGAEKLPEEIRGRPPVLLVHGDSDPVIPYQAMPAATAALKAIDVSVTAETRPGLAHGIDQEAVDLASGFLKRHLLAATA
ncbi:alpha/beta hydrolase [Ferruginivarius sediminum]|uniref:Abhydrolase domain-containing 18 n=1 Tax=Ferruginivarius sediminum TaxID=2661937 RepID=A0A369T8P0_9PROT|nr:alpha/beta fold hydrolase [Ferruginivarius sediminum]RDD60725.1 abhydrolase domain-containing 18 [Ferruginivarius sediminum]